MQREEAEAEAERRNTEDPGRARFEFYAFDVSAGMSADAWDVGQRLRRGFQPEPQTAQAASTQEQPAVSEGPPVFHEEPPVVAEPPPMSQPPPVVHEEPPVVTGAEPWAPSEEPWEETAVFADSSAEDRPWEEAPPKSPLFVRILGSLVMVTGLLWIGLMVALAVFLKPDNALSFGVYVAAAVLGLLAMCLGFAIRRS